MEINDILKSPHICFQKINEEGNSQSQGKDIEMKVDSDYIRNLINNVHKPIQNNGSPVKIRRVITESNMQNPYIPINPPHHSHFQNSIPMNNEIILKYKEEIQHLYHSFTAIKEKYNTELKSLKEENAYLKANISKLSSEMEQKEKTQKSSSNKENLVEKELLYNHIQACESKVDILMDELANRRQENKEKDSIIENLKRELSLHRVSNEEIFEKKLEISKAQESFTMENSILREKLEEKERELETALIDIEYLEEKLISKEKDISELIMNK